MVAECVPEWIQGIEMSHLTPYEGFLLNLAGEVPPTMREFLPKEEARAILVKLTGQDFGLDVEMWTKWLREHDKIP